MLRLRFERLQRGWSQADLGRQVHIRQSDVSLIERGRLLPMQAQLEALARVLGLAPEEVLQPLLLPERREDAFSMADRPKPEPAGR